MLRCRAWLKVATRGRQRLDELAGAAGVLFDERQVARLLLRRRDLGLADVVGLALELGDGGFEPGEVHVLAGDDVLVGVVEVVARDVTRHGDVPLAHREAGLVEFAEGREKFRRFHVPCFCLQLMQTRVQGIASSRAAAIGSPQSRQMP